MAVGQQSKPTRLKIGNIEIYKDWPFLTDKIEEMIDSAEIIQGAPFVRLKYVLEWKRKSKRKKDLKDVQLIEKYNLGP